MATHPIETVSRARLRLRTLVYVKVFCYLCRELDRKQGMIDDLKQVAETGFGLSPEDCELLEQTVIDRDHLKTATDAMAAYFY